MSTKKNDTLEGALGIIFLLIFLFSWLSIPDTSVPSGFDIASLTFANGIFDGWADNLAVKFLYADYQQESAKEAFRNAILIGEKDFPMATAIFNVLGAFLSIGGVIAVWVARSAANSSEAFSFGFWAEVIESIVFHAGYYTTVGESSVTGMEVVITLIVAVIMGIVAVQINRRHISRYARSAA